ncbi:hypothetical protein ACFJIV_15560 [Mucilaginibacter sp. UC70_90]
MGGSGFAFIRTENRQITRIMKIPYKEPLVYRKTKATMVALFCQRVLARRPAISKKTQKNIKKKPKIKVRP